MAKAKTDPLEVWEAYLASGKANNPFVIEMRLHPHWQGYQPSNQEHVNALNWMLTAKSAECNIGGFQAHVRQRGTIGAIGRQTDEFYDRAALTIILQLMEKGYIRIYQQYQGDDVFGIVGSKLVRFAKDDEHLSVTDEGNAFLTKRCWNPWVGEVIAG